MKIVVIIPTYNERDNIESLVKALARERGLIKKHDLQVLFVDDTSPDKTYEVIQGWQKKYKWIHLLLSKKKQGLGGAYVNGIKYAVHKLKAGGFVEMDADLQHNPEDIKRFIKELDNGFDYVIGSRYVKKGSIPNEWDFSRKFLSVVGNLVARALLLLPQIHDVTTGFKLTRVKGFVAAHKSTPMGQSTDWRTSPEMKRFYNGNFLHTLDMNTLISTSFAYKIQLLHEMVLAGAKVKEVPIRFLSRNKGESKIIKNELFETLRVIFLLQLRNPKIKQFVKFGIVGFIGYLVQAASLQFLSWLAVPEWLIWGGSAEMAIVSNFTWNNHWTFRARKIRGKRNTLWKFFHFNLTSAGAIVIQIVAGSALVHLFGPHRQIYLPLIIGLLIVPYNYFIYTRLIWRR
jgi:dolichol-phosphate mannosyltransferase